MSFMTFVVFSTIIQYVLVVSWDWLRKRRKNKASTFVLTFVTPHVAPWFFMMIMEKYAKLIQGQQNIERETERHMVLVWWYD